MRSDWDNLNLGYHQFDDNYGFYISKVNQNVINEVNIKVEGIQADWSKGILANDKLAGEIKHEYFTSITPHLKKHIKEQANKLDSNSGYSRNYLDDNGKLLNTHKWDINYMWINYQRKNEYNPMHKHDGIFSWVLWHKVPYTIINEAKLSSKPNDPRTDKDVNHSLNGYFSFFTASRDSHIAGVENWKLPVDNSYEGYFCIFPSDLQHEVYPFYSTDEYRITLSGNIINVER